MICSMELQFVKSLLHFPSNRSVLNEEVGLTIAVKTDMETSISGWQKADKA